VPGVWFTSVLEESETPAHGGYVDRTCPVAEEAARHLVNLPTHPRVRDDDAERIADAVAAAMPAAAPSVIPQAMGAR
jgi:dTDP-4-amino-4,6-dideoxygalactose transaminase